MVSTRQISSMAPAWRRLLKHHQRKTLVELCRRPKVQEQIAGFVIDFSDKLILLHRLDWNTFRLDGYTILRDVDVHQKRFFSRSTCWQVKAAKKWKLRPQPVSINLTNWETAAKDIHSLYPLLTVHREIRFANECWIGLPLEVSPRDFVLDNLDPNAEWTGPYSMKTADITRIDFNGGYENALASGAPKRPILRPRGLVQSLRGLRGLNLKRQDEPTRRKRGR